MIGAEKKNWKRSIVLSLLLLLAGCATNLYVPLKDGEPHGYSEEQLNENMYRVQFESYKSIDRKVLQALMERRAAEIVLHNGYSYLVLTDVVYSSEIEVVEIPEVIMPSSKVYTGSGALGITSPILSPDVAIPAHTREITKKKISATVVGTNSSSVEGAKPIASLLPTPSK